MRKIKNFFKNKYVIIGLVIVVIIAIFIFSRGSSNGNFETATVVRGTVTEIVSVTGKVLPVEKADLAFEKSGAVSRISVKVGNTVANGQTLASLDSAADLANLQSAQAKLDDIKRTLRPEELAAEKAKVDSALVALENAKKDTADAFRDGYVKAQGAVVNNTDSFFDNPQSVNPTINIRTSSSNIERATNEKRLAVTMELNKWKAELDTGGSADGTGTALENANNRLGVIKGYMSALSAIVNDLNPGNSGLTQTTIDSHVLAMNNAQAGLNQAITAVTGAETDLKNKTAAYGEAQDNFTLKNAGSSAEAIRAQEATVASYRAELSKDTLVSPIGGLVTRVEPDLGEFVSAGSVQFSVQSYGDYEIETFVPEADIAKITLNNTARVTLDAYGSDTVFPAKVTAIDPAETVLEGVPTYKVTLYFTEKDSRVRSGMTANTDIMTREKSGVLAVPSRAIIEEDGQKVVRVLNADGKTYDSVPVTVGLKGSDGTTEIIEGLNEGQSVVTYVK